MSTGRVKGRQWLKSAASPAARSVFLSMSSMSVNSPLSMSENAVELPTMPHPTIAILRKFIIIVVFVLRRESMQKNDINGKATTESDYACKVLSYLSVTVL